jgi:hypothetical protein
MSQVSTSSSMLWFPQTSSEQALVREQLKQILAHPLFKHSKRYPTMLRYVVEQTLLGNVDQLKERIIGVEVFDRDPMYDPSADPIVRFTAAEIRKRLAQYYVERSHSAEMQIDLPVGSYAAVFHPRPVREEIGQTPASLEPVEMAATDVPQIERGPLDSESAKQLRVVDPVVARLRPGAVTTWLVVTAVLMGILGICIGLFLHARLRPASGPMDEFWSSVIAGPGIITICVGVPNVPTSAVTIRSADPSFWNDSSHLAISDVIALTHLTSALDARGRSYNIFAAPKTSFTQLREGPVILIGAFDNPWTMRLTRNLRYTFVRRNGESVGIVDSRNPLQSNWTLPLGPANEKFTHDFGVVARFRDSTTGQPVVLVAGVAAAGTEAASELLSNRALFIETMKDAPRNWANMNMEVVLETQVIDDHPGRPKIVASAYW